MSRQWHTFYEKRVNSSYQEYFEKRYNPVLDLISILLPEHNNNIVEIGCGIGSISKTFLNNKEITFTGFDINNQMVQLANTNTNTNCFYQDDLFNFNFINNNNLKVSHGVLEHFDDEQLLLIKEKVNKSLHYVPLNGYKEPSFGNERLLPKEFWIEMFNPIIYIVFNNNKDLVFYY